MALRVAWAYLLQLDQFATHYCLEHDAPGSMDYHAEEED